MILFIGDGMGPSQVNLGRIVKGQPLAIESIPQVGLCRTDSLTGPITDSAAAITAIACGVKTKNRSLGVDGEGKPVPSIADDLKARGYRTAVVTNTRITHATPGGFFGHSADREDEKAIAQQLVDGTLDLAIGGGARVFPEARKEAFAAKGGRTVTSLGALVAASQEPAFAIDWSEGSARAICLLAESHMAYDVDRPASEPMLAQMADAAIRMLSQPRADGSRPPFLLLVEGGRIDHAGHGHDAAVCAKEVIAFDLAVKVGLRHAREGGRTLVLVTADHATGGLAVSEKLDAEGIRRVQASAASILAEANGDARKLRELAAAKAGVGLTLEECQAAVTRKHKYSGNGTLAHTLSERFGAFWAYPLDVQEGMDSTEGHDGTLIPIWAEGPGAERFRGVIENTDIAAGVRAVVREYPSAVPPKIKGRREF